LSQLYYYGEHIYTGCIKNTGQQNKLEN